MKLPDDVEIYPAHGAGSMCGKSMSTETSSTIGEQKKTNYALKPMAKDDFVRMMTSDLPEAPAYFPKDAEINRGGAQPLAEVLRPAALTAQGVNELATHGHLILDTRSAYEFGTGHVPGSLNIGLGGQFAIWAGCLISMGTPIVVVAASDVQVDEAVMRLARVGIETVIGYLHGGIEAWREAGLGMAHIAQISVGDLRHLVEKESEFQIIDVRRPPEYASGHVPHALHAPLSTLQSTASTLALDPAKSTAVICAGGYRSSAASSILKQHGFRRLLNVTGGTGAWIDAGYPVETPKC
jgi:rhodanese-related sulfurtransferase